MTASGAYARMDARRLLELLAVLIIVLSVVGLAAARLGMFHAPQIWLIGLLGTFGYHRLTSARAVPAIESPPYWHLALVLGIALVFRLTPYAYVLGGQDEGVYFNMAMHIAHTGGLQPVDNVLAEISDPAILEHYRHANYRPTLYLPGVYANGEGLEFQFYHLFPVWLALFADIFGVEGAGYGLTMLSLASILYFQRLAHLISGRAGVGLLAGLLLAVNPLHAFFSKFPVTEVPTVAFSAMSFVFLLEYWRSAQTQQSRRYLAISIAALGLLFLTRISGFMYLPSVVAIGAAALLFDPVADRRRDISLWTVLVVMVYAFSVLDGLKWSGSYSEDIYAMAFAHAFGEHWKALIAATAIAGVLGWTALWALAHNEVARSRIRSIALSATTLLPFVAMGLVALAVYKAYRLGYTDAYAADPWLGKRFQLAHQGAESVFSTSLAAAGVYLSPFILVAGLVAAFLVRRNAILLLLLFFVVCFLGYIAVMQWALPYQPYYARYLLSEFVPYLMLLAVCAWALLGHGRLRVALGAALVLGGVYCGVLSSMQIGKSEHGGVLESLGHVVSHVDRGDLVVVDQAMGSPPVYDIKTALVFTYGLNVATMTSAEAAGGKYRDTLFDQYDEVYLLTRTPNAPAGFHAFDSVNFQERAFRTGATPPIETYLRNDSRLFVHKWDPQSPDAVYVRFAAGRAGARLLGAGWSTPEPWGVWTSGRTAHFRLGVRSLRENKPDKPFLRIVGRAYVSTQSPVQRIRVSMAGKIVAESEVRFPQQHVQIDVPLAGSDLGGDHLELAVETPDAVSPSALGNSSDTRVLAFGLQEVEFRDAAGPIR